MPGLTKPGGGSKGSSSGTAYRPRQSYSPRSAAAGNKLKKSTPASSGGRVKYSSGPSIKSNSSGQYGATPPVPAAAPGNIDDVNAYLGGDSGYQDQLRQLAKALSDFQADTGRRQGTLDTEFGVSKRALGDQRTLDLDNIEEDYASRGLLKSGVYAGAVGDYEKEYGERVSDLDRRQQQALQLLMQERSSYENQNSLEQQAAREAAIRRRAETYGV
jgi:hypothetical protein